MAVTCICILGDVALVQEYASLCLNKRFNVHVRQNPDKLQTANGTRLPKGVKKVSRPQKGTTLALELTNLSAEAKKRNLQELDRTLGTKVPILSSSVTVTAAEQSTWISRPERLIGLGALPSLLGGGLMEFAASQATDSATVQRAVEFARALGKESAVVQDTVGLVLPRILCTLANEACFALAENLASPADIDTAMKLGTNYPFGPLEWMERIGVRHVHAVMTALHGTSGEERYRAAPVLRKAATLNRSVHNAEVLK